MKILGCVLFFLASISCIHGYRILFLAPFNGPSHWLFLEKFIKELVHRGHHVTSITGLPLTGPKPSNYTEVLINPPFDITSVVNHHDVFKSAFNSDLENVKMYLKLGEITSRHSLQDAGVQKLIHSTDLHFDLVILEQFFHESWLMFAHKFQAPIITISTYGASDFFDRNMGMLTPWSHVAHMLLSYTDNMTFTQRLYNVFISVYDLIMRDVFSLAEHNKQAREFFGHLEKNGQPLPSIQELEKNISMIFVNSHRSIAAPRPLMPGIINVAGAHIKDPKPLPADIQKYLDESKHGVIYFSLGSYMKSSNMPKHMVSVFVETFAKLKQNVLWKFEDESLTNIPSNVMIRKWMPQSDILAHKNVILFMSHGGLFGNLEGIHRGVPMLFTPLYGDQYRNSLRAKTSGYGETLKFADVTRESLLEKLTEMVTNKKHFERAKELSAIFRDNLVHPMDEAMFWIEYVCRHKGAKHLKSHAVNMPWYSYLLLDIIALVLSSVLFVLLLIWGILKLICNISKNNHNRKQNAKLKKK